MAINQYKNYKQAKKVLEEVFKTPHGVIFIHYSCESFFDIPNGASPRITTIALRFLGSGQTKSFSIHHEAELKKLGTKALAIQYDKLEKTMLKKFFKAVEQFAPYKWLHWNMRDANYGFEAISHRYRVLGGVPAEIQDSNKVDLAQLMHKLLGRNYISHPRLPNLLEKNGMTPRNFMLGKDEANAFEQKEFLKLHQSTLSKADALMDLATAAYESRLKCDNNYAVQRGLTLSTVGAIIKDHPLFSTLGVLAVILTIIVRSLEIIG